MVLAIMSLLPTVAQDIDLPLSLKEIRKLSSLVKLQRLTAVETKHPDAYKIDTERDVYTTDTKKMRFNVITSTSL